MVSKNGNSFGLTSLLDREQFVFQLEFQSCFSVNLNSNAASPNRGYHRATDAKARQLHAVPRRHWLARRVT